MPFTARPAVRVRIPVIEAPLFIISNPKLVIAQCTAGVVGSMPALNARPASLLDEWLAEITEGLATWDRARPERPAAPPPVWVPRPGGNLLPPGPSDIEPYNFGR